MASVLIQAYRDRGFPGAVFSGKTANAGLSVRAFKFLKKEYVYGRNVADIVPKTHNLVEGKDRITLLSKNNNKGKAANAKRGKRNRKHYKKKAPSNLVKVGRNVFRTRNANIADSNVSGTARVTLDGGGGRTFTKDESFTQAGRSYDDIEQKVMDKVNSKYAGASSHVLDIKILNITVHKAGKRIELSGIPMRLANPLLIRGLGEQPWNRHEGTCVTDYIGHLYGYHEKVDIASWCDPRLFDECFPNRFTEGITIEELIDYAHSVHPQPKVIAMDQDFKSIMIYHPETARMQVPPIVFILKHGHMYPIEHGNPLYHKMVCRFGKDNGKRPAGVKAAIQKSEKERLANMKCVILESSNREETMCRIVHDAGMDASNIQCSDSAISSFEVGDTINVFEDVGVNEMKEYLGDSFRGESFMTIVKDITKDLLHSRFNKITFDKLETPGTKALTHFGFVNARGKDLFDVDTGKWKTKLRNGKKIKIETIDIRSSYGSVLANPDGKLLLFDYSAQFSVFKGTNVVPGLYVVDTKDTKLFCKKGIYDYMHVLKGISEGLINYGDVKEVMAATECLPKDYFDEFRRRRDELKLGRKLNKLVTNGLCGLLGKTTVNRRKRYVNTNRVEVDNYFHRTAFEETALHERTIDDVTYYVYGNKNTTPIMKNNLPMYIQIVCQQARNMYDKCKEIGWNRVLYRKADAITFMMDKNEITSYVSEGIGGWRKCENPTKPVKASYSQPEYVMKTDVQWEPVDAIETSNDWEHYIDMIKNKQSAMTNACPGRGKSYVIGKINNAGLRVLTMAPTNTAANRIGGHTFHHSLGLAYDDADIPIKIINRIKTEYDVVIVDECSMVSKPLWSKLGLIKDQCDVTILCFGDDKQLVSMDDFTDYINNCGVMNICDYNLIDLQWHENCRLSYEDDQTLHAVREGDIESVLACNTVRSTDDVSNVFLLDNIVWTNKVRREVNTKVRDQELNNGNLTNPMTLVRDESELCESAIFEGVDIIAENMKLIAYTNKKGKWFNGSFYTLQKYNVDEDGDVSITLYDDEAEKKILIKSVVEFLNNFTLGYAVTNHKVQGATLDKVYGVWEIMDCFDNDWRYVAVSRTRNLRGGIIFYLPPK